MKTFHYFSLALLLHAFYCTVTSSEDYKKNEDSISNVKLFQKLYKEKRREQQEAVKSILKYDSVRQYKLIDVIATKSFQVLEDSQIKLREAGYVPGMDFPNQANVREALSLCLESTAFMGEILLHFPDATHQLLNDRKSSTLIFTWGLFFASQSAFLDDQTKKLIYLASQELEIAERDPKYVNPYAKASRRAPPTADDYQDEGEAKRKKKTKKKKTFKKGPMLSRQLGDL